MDLSVKGRNVAGSLIRSGFLCSSIRPASGIDRVFVAGMALASFGPLKVKPILGFLGGTIDKADFASFKLKELKYRSRAVA
jgi:hypothetical protein